MAALIDVLIERGLIDTLTSEEVKTLTESHSTKVYCGFDPSADSLHLGNLVAIMGLAWFQRFGHTPVIVVGGATGMIGDPSGKTSERKLLDEETIHHNLKGIQKTLERLLQGRSASHAPLFFNNLEWYHSMSCLSFLRDIGKHFRLGTMLAKESVRLRLQSDEGMSFTEFSYQLLQGYDFLHLYRTHGVTIQLGGSDQWGNITAGTELIRRVLGKGAHGLTFPLLTTADGKKFGKSEKGAIWLSPEKLSPYEFYQYLIRVEDADVIQLMRLLTFMEMEEIREYERQLRDRPMMAQRRLAEEVTRWVHGEEALQLAQRITEGMSPGSRASLNIAMLESLINELPQHTLTFRQMEGKRVIDLLVETGLQPSKGEARRLLRNGGVYLNNETLDDADASLQLSWFLDGKLLLLAAGKKQKILIRLVPHSAHDEPVNP